MNTLLIYTDCRLTKLEYILDFLCSEFLNCGFEITDDLDSFVAKNGVLKLNYSTTIIKDVISIPFSSYFNEFKIGLDFDFTEELKIIGDNCSFDVFAAAFYLLVRVEEYGSFVKDKHERFTSDQSILSRKKLLQKPIVDYWFMTLKNALEVKSNCKLDVNKGFQFKSTIDIDHIYAYAEKPMFVRVGGILRDTLSFKFGRLKDRFLNSDPYNTFADIQYLNTKHGHELHSFILTAARGPFDKSFPPSHKAFKLRIKELSNYSTIGIHPSYASDSSAHNISKEKKELEVIVEKPINSSRQHFVKLEFPKTYRALIEAGVQHDYSMGYADRSGFRAGTSRIFKWYDLINDQITDLTVHPFQLMDVTLKNYEKLSPNQAVEKAASIISHCKRVNGMACLIWHNSSFYEREGWGGWKEVYENILSMANLKNNNTLDSK